MRIRKPTTPETADPDDPHAQAVQQRQKAVAARAEADILLATARAQAERLVADATARAQDLTRTAAEADKLAAKHEALAAELDAVDSLRTQIADLERDIVGLDARAGEHRTEQGRLDGRLTDLGEQREDTTAALATARQAGDVDQVREQRARMAAIDEVVAELTGQREDAKSAEDGIGPADGSGTLGRAAQRLLRLRTDLRAALNRLDPDRPEAVLDHALQVVTDHMERIATPEPEQRNVVVRPQPR